MPLSLRTLSRAVSLTLTVAFVGALAACGDDSSSADPTASCASMCTGAGFTGSNLQDEGHETNCFCTGGSGEITAAACTTMCESVDKPGKPFTSGQGVAKANACQCQ